MNKRPFSIRAKLSFIVIFMGLLGILLALATGGIYTRLILDNYRAAIAELGRLKSDELLLQLKENSAELAMALQQPQAFQHALDSQDWAALVAMLNDQFRQYLHTGGIVNLKRLEVYGRDFQLLSTSTEVLYPTNTSVCPDLIAKAAARQGKERLKTFADICLHAQHSYHLAVVPISIMQPKGYIAVLSDPAFNLRRVEAGLALPVEITDTSGEVLYRSANWQDEHELHYRLLAHHEIQTHDAQTALRLALLSDTRPLNAELRRTRNFVIAFTVIVIGILVLAVLAFAQRRVIGPLQMLTREVRHMGMHSGELGKTIEVSGSLEINLLAHSFNEMSQELAKLQRRLEKLAYIDALTELPNRAMFYRRLSEVAQFCRSQHSSFALFMIDLNRFKEVNDTLGHHVGDALLRAVGGRLRSLLRRSDTIVHVHDENSEVEDQTIARLGGDEFVVIAPLVNNRMGAERIARKLLELVDKEFTVANHTVHVGMSIGIVFYPEHSDDCETLMHYADQAMYLAKQQQCGFVFYGDGMKLGHEAVARSSKNNT
jgi:diguanylate cyclase